MLHIILTILKIIGILILVLLALLLVCIGIVLFVPIRYRAEGKKDEDGYFLKAEVYWLFRLFRVKALYPEPGQIAVKFLWFTLFDSKAEEKPEKEKKRKKKGKPEKQNRNKKKRKAGEKKEEQGKQLETEKERAYAKETGERLKQQEIVENTDKKEGLTDQSAENFAEDSAKRQRAEENGEAEEKEDRIARIFHKIKAFFKKIIHILKNIQYTIRKVCDKIKEICGAIQYYAEVFGEEETKKAFELCRQQLFKVWKNIRPKKCRVWMRIGTGEPDTTGYILALHGILYPFLGNTVFIEPDFEHQVFEGNFSMKGRVTVFVLVYVAVKLYFDENIRYFLKRFKREE